MKIAILGSRGIPACYSGYDTLVEELAFGLVKTNATEVLVYCRDSYYKDRISSLRGVKLIYLPAPRLKGVESLIHSFISSLHVIWQKADIIYFVDPANAPFCLFLRLLGKRVVIHTNGLGWKRSKWGPFARRYYKFVEWLSARTAHALVTDNPAMQDYYRNEYNADSVYIPYGAESSYGVDDSIYKQFYLQRQKYMLLVARIEPENNVDFIIEEYCGSSVKLPLIVVGDSPYNPQYMDYLHRLANDRVIFAGRLDNQPKLNALYKGAYLYIHGHSVGGTNPSLLRAMYAGTAPLVFDVPFNRSVISDFGFLFERKKGDLSNTLNLLTKSPEEVSRIAKGAHHRARTYFTWENVINEHVVLFRRVMENT